ncbi:MAG: ABC transporter ATP-binding protein [Candidatus Omnitrophota bacterium]
MNKLKVINLGKVYHEGRKRLEVLKGINLEIKDGSFTCIIGPSGAGKSTLLHLLGGLDYPSKGEVFFDNINLYALSQNDLAAIRNQRIGFVFQFYHLLPELSVIENVMLPGRIARGDLTMLKKKAAALLEQMGLQERITHRPFELSGGEQQRTAIARALINEPELVLCDEPTGNLDSETGRKIIEILSRLNKEEKKTLIIVTHEKTITEFAGQVVHIRDGKIV